MNIEEIINKMKQIQQYLIEYIDNEDDIEEKYQNLIFLFQDQKIQDNKQEIRIVLHLLSQIAKNHFRYSNFHDKIKRILLFFKNEINKYFYKFEIINLFKGNKNIMLFLITEEIIKVDESMIAKMKKSHEYFSPEFKLKDETLPDIFYENRKIGENDDLICKMIREDLIDEFISHVNKMDTPLQSTIKPSIFETNSFLAKKQPTLIEYAAFFGSIQIFKYLYNNIPIINTSSLWIYSIHSDNPEMINFLKENSIDPYKNDYVTCFEESIKCHHNDIAKYIINNFVHEDNEKLNIISLSLKYHNYSFIDGKSINKSHFYDLCRYDHPLIAEMLCKNTFIDVNERIISEKTIFMKFLYLFFNRILILLFR